MKFCIVSKKEKGIFLIFLAFLIFFYFSPQFTAIAEESELNFHVKPNFPESQIEGSTSYFDLNIDPGKQENLGLTLTNTSSEKITIKITAYTAHTNVNGVVEYGKPAVEKDTTLLYEMESLIDTPDPITLLPNEEKEISFPINMPPEKFDGILAGGLRIEEVSEESKNEEKTEENLSIKNEFSFIIGVIASNTRSNVVPELELIDVFPDQLNYRNVFSVMLQNIAPAFVNQLEVKVLIRAEGEDQILYESETKDMQMAPNSNFNYPIPLNGDAFKNGKYIASVTAVSGEKDWSWEHSFTVDQETARRLNRSDVTVDTSTNWWMIVAATLILLLGLLIAYLFYQKRKREKAYQERQAQIAKRKARRAQRARREIKNDSK